MERAIDLDEAAVTAALVVSACDLPGLRVEEFTWREMESGWPQVFVTDRRSIAEPFSMGIKATRGDREGALVVYYGGWVDISFIDVGKASYLEEAVGVEKPLDIAAYRDVLSRFLALFR